MNATSDKASKKRFSAKTEGERRERKSVLRARSLSDERSFRRYFTREEHRWCVVDCNPCEMDYAMRQQRQQQHPVDVSSRCRC